MSKRRCLSVAASLLLVSLIYAQSPTKETPAKEPGRDNPVRTVKYSFDTAELRWSDGVEFVEHETELTENKLWTEWTESGELVVAGIDYAVMSATGLEFFTGTIQGASSGCELVVTIDTETGVTTYECQGGCPSGKSCKLQSRIVAASNSTAPGGNPNEEGTAAGEGPVSVKIRIECNCV